MSDLISRQMVMDYLRVQQAQVIMEKARKKAITYEALKGAEASIEAFMNFINQAPTAYDVDKIVERLENNILSDTDGDSDEPCINPCADCENSMWGRAIEIVKACGVNE